MIKRIIISLLFGLFVCSPLFAQSRTHRQLRIGSRIGSSTAGTVLYVDTNKKLADDIGQLVWDAINNRLGIGTESPTVKLDVNGDIKIPTANAFYFGAIDTDGSWRIIKSGNDLVFERRESSIWVEKGSMTP